MENNSLMTNEMIEQIKQVMGQARANVAKVVNNELITAYWNIGRIIVEHEQENNERAAYGKQTLKELSKVLTEEFGKGFSVSNLQFMRRFYQTYQIQQTLSVKLSWSHYCELLLISEDDKRFNFAKLKPLIETTNRSFFHGGLPEDFNFSKLDPLRLAQRQNTNGQNYAGFYMSEKPSFSANYAEKSGNALHKLQLQDDLKFKLYDGNITRVEQGILKDLIDQGYDIVQGRNPSGQMEYILLNPSKIQKTDTVDWRNVLSKLGKNVGKVLPIVGGTYGLYDTYRQLKDFQENPYMYDQNLL